MYAIETTDLTKHYQRGTIRALQEVSLTVKPGCIFSLLGPNGAGKTTLIKLLLGIAFPTGGSARILAEPISDHHVHKKIGYLAENHRFPDFLTANQVLYYYGKMAGVDKPTLESKIPLLLERVKLTGWGDTRIRKFSKGMLQRMGLAQALINDPELLFLDEPTDGIDPVGRREVRDLLTELRNEGKTIFLNSHLLSEVERVSDEVAILNKGRVVRQGTVEDFIAIEQQFQFFVDDETGKLAAACTELDVNSMPQNGHFVLSFRDDAHMNKMIDRLRADAVTIKGIVPRKITLEDFFIDVIEEEEGQS